MLSNLFDKRVHLIKIDSFKGAIGTVFNFKAYRDVRRWYIKIDPDICTFSFIGVRLCWQMGLAL